ncbi:MAG: DegV family protein [Clostridiales bacterium]|nr:DegV family protein [Clostridiales bacterium]
MNRDYILSCCSTADLSKEHMEKRDIHYACMHYFLDGKEYADDLGQTMPFDRFYQKMQEGSDTKTSQINADEFVAYFRPFLEQGLDIVHVSLSSGISGTCNSANIAKDTLMNEFPDRKIWIVDSLAASSGYGLFMDILADLRDDGRSAEELYNWAMQNRLTIHHWFFSTDLTFYVKGGRISKASGWFGTVLNICPLLNVDDEGKLIPRQKIRGKRAVIREIVKKMREHALDGTNYNGKCYMSHSACYEDARAVADLVEAAFPKLQEPVLINSIGTTIGSHTGPGTVALFFVGDERVH